VVLAVLVAVSAPTPAASACLSHAEAKRATGGAYLHWHKDGTRRCWAARGAVNRKQPGMAGNTLGIVGHAQPRPSQSENNSTSSRLPVPPQPLWAMAQQEPLPPWVEAGRFEGMGANYRVIDAPTQIPAQTSANHAQTSANAGLHLECTNEGAKCRLDHTLWNATAAGMLLGIAAAAGFWWSRRKAARLV